MCYKVIINIHTCYVLVGNHCRTPDLPILQFRAVDLENLEGTIIALLFRCLFGCHAGDSSDVTLAFKDAQVI